MNQQEQERISNLEELLDHLDEAAETARGERIHVEHVLKTVGQRAFGPMLLVPGLIALSPLSGMPGVPTAVGIMVLLITGQLLLGRSQFWLPQFVLRRSIRCDRFVKTLKFLRPVARFVDRLTGPRLEIFAQGAATYAIAALCLVLSLIAPLLEVLPFAITGAGAAVTAFGLALIAHDGLLALLALAFCAGTAFLLVTTVF